MNKTLSFILLLLTLTVNAVDESVNENESLDLNNVSLEGLDSAVAEVFVETKAIIEQARQEGNQDLEFSATKEWCLLLHNFDFLQQAKNCYYKIGMDAKKEPKWSYLFGKASFEQGQMEDAKKGFSQTISLDNSYLPAHYYLIKMSLEDGELKHAFKLKSQVPPELQLSSNMLKISGDLYFEVENYHVAIGYYQQALSMVEGAKSLHYKIAQAYGLLQQQDLAQEHLTMSNEVAIKLPDPYYQEVKSTTVGEVPYLIKAKAALVNGDAKLAIENYNKALSFNPNSQAAILNIAAAYYQDQQVDKAKQLFSQVLDSDPNQQLALYNLATIATRQGDYRVAAMYFEKYMKTNPADITVNVELIKLYYQLKDYQKVIDLSESKSLKANEVAQLAKAKSMIQLQQYEPAMKLLQDIHKYKPDNREVMLLLAKLFSQVPQVSLRNEEQAFVFINKAITVEKDTVAMWQLLKILDEAGRCQKLQQSVSEFILLFNLDSTLVKDKLIQERADALKCRSVLNES